MKTMTMLAGAVAGLAFAAAPAAAVDLVDSPIAVTSADVGSAFTYNFAGFVNEQNVSSLTSAIKFTLTSVSGNIWKFRADFDNTLSSAPVGGRISGFGFDGNPEIVGATPGAGPFTSAQLDARFPQTGGQTRIDFCIESQGGGNCGGGGGGVANGTTATQLFSLTFANNPTTAVTFNNFILRYQSVTGTTLGTSGIGVGTGTGDFDIIGGVVPEPASWAMLIAGFGMVGFAARRRRSLNHVSA